MTMAYDPCFTCPLADCNEDDPGCNLRRANRVYSNLRRRGLLTDASPEVRDGYNAWFTVWRLERDARRSEGHQ